MIIASPLQCLNQLDQQQGELFQTEFSVRDYPKGDLVGRFVVPCVLGAQRLEAISRKFGFLLVKLLTWSSIYQTLFQLRSKNGCGRSLLKY